MAEKWKHIASEYVVSLFPIFIMVEAFDLGMKRFLGKSCAISFKIERGAIVYYSLLSTWKAVHLELVKRIKNDPLFLRRMFHQMETDGRKQAVFTARFKKMAWSRLSSRALYKYYSDYLKSNIRVYLYGLVVPLLDYQELTFLSDEITRILKNRKAEKYFGVLTQPPLETFQKRQELDLLKLFIEIKKDKKLYLQFRGKTTQELVPILKAHYPHIWNLIKRHTSRYAWVNYVYEGPALTEEYFIDFLKDFIRRKINPQKESRKYYQEKKLLQMRQKKILQEIHADAYERQIITLARDAVFYKPYRRELQTWSYYHMEFLLQEIARRLGLTLKQVRMILPRELREALFYGRLNLDLINQRLQLVVYGRRFGKEFCYVRKRAEKFIKEKVELERKAKKVKEISGATAFAGKVSGRVRIVNMPEEMEKMEEGDVLVSRATSPNLMPAIRKARGIVTDEGGLTSHAAIVSREFKIPCVVGTKIATEVLKDGDRVEVDAEKGVVRKI